MTTPVTSNNPRILIIGAGLAGMSAAVALESIGANVTLFESRKSLGGRAGSFLDPQTGEELDNCQHVLLGCCTNLIDFYRRIHVSHQIRWEKAIHFRDAKGKQYSLKATPGLPAPGHLGLSFATFGALTFAERIAYSRAMIAMLQLGREGRKALADVPFGQWLDQHHQPPALVDKMYDPVLIGSLNEQCRVASAEYAIQVFQDAMLAHADGYILGLANCPLSQLYATLPVKDVRMSTRVSELRFNGNKVIGITLADGEQIDADAVVVATNHHSLPRWIPPELAATDARFSGLEKIESVPILGVHLWFDHPVLKESHAALITGPLQWLFRKDAEGKSVHGVISAAREWANKSKEECLKLFEAQVRAVLPGAAHAKLERGVIVIEKRATFSPLPGIDRLRPSQAPNANGIQNLYLAGDYTKTGWPATMEGAVRSGYLAADAVIHQAAAQSPLLSFIVPDLPVQWPAKLMGL